MKVLEELVQLLLNNACIAGGLLYSYTRRIPIHSRESVYSETDVPCIAVFFCAVLKITSLALTAHGHAYSLPR